MKTIALVAHDKKKQTMIEFVTKHKEVLCLHTLFATGTTGSKIIESTNLHITCLNSGPLGGDQQIGALISERKIDIVIFFRDPLSAQPHEPDIIALLRLCDVYNIPLATNIACGEIILNTL